MTNPNNFDVIVIGVGSMGSAACYYLADRGYRVLGLEQFGIVHDRGSHTGQSRIIRKAYFEHPDYVPLLNRAYGNWESLREQTGVNIYRQTGIVYLGEPSNPTMEGIRASAFSYNIPVEKFSASEGKSRFAQFNPPANFEVLYEPEAGFVTPEKAIQTYVSEGRRRGADIREHEKVNGWSNETSTITVTTDTGTYSAKKLVITSGAWTSRLVPALAGELTVTKQLLAWVSPTNVKQFSLGNFPCWFIEDPDLGLFYGFPALDESTFGGPRGMKIAHHHPGEKWDPETTGPGSVPPGAEENIRIILKKYIPEAGVRITATRQCLYTYSPDTNFIIDTLPETDGRVTIACGFSGHGFKFVSVVGEILADLAIEGSTQLPIDFLRMNRLMAE